MSNHSKGMEVEVIGMGVEAEDSTTASGRFFKQISHKLLLIITTFYMSHI